MPPVSKSEFLFVVDGAQFTSLEEFFDVVGNVLIPGVEWGHNLDASNDILRGGFGTPDEGFTIRWKNSTLSQCHLGYPETVRQLRQRLERCHPDNRSKVAQELEDALRGVGPTVFHWLVEIIHDHGPGGGEEEDNVMLELE